MQVVQSTPPQELLRNELVREFAERCQSAARSIQRYINADNPAPDEETLLTLIETNDMISAALSKHQRALLQARKISTQTPPNLSSRGTLAPESSGPTLPPRSPGRDQSDTEPPSVAKAGLPPILGMPKPAARLENPFDDLHASNHSGEINGHRNGTEGGSQAASSTSYGAHGPHLSREDDDSPEQPKRYRF